MQSLSSTIKAACRNLFLPRKNILYIAKKFLHSAEVVLRTISVSVYRKGVIETLFFTFMLSLLSRTGSHDQSSLNEYPALRSEGGNRIFFI